MELLLLNPSKNNTHEYSTISIISRDIQYYIYRMKYLWLHNVLDTFFVMGLYIDVHLYP